MLGRMKILLHSTLKTSLTIELIAFHSSHIKSSLLYTIQTAYDISLLDTNTLKLDVLLTFQFLTPRVGQILSVLERPCGFYLHCFCSVGPELLGPSLFSSLDSETIKSKSRLAGFGGSSRWWPWSKRMGVLSIRYTPLVSYQQMMRSRSGEEMCDWCLSVCAARAWA